MSNGPFADVALRVISDFVKHRFAFSRTRVASSPSVLTAKLHSRVLANPPCSASSPRLDEQAHQPPLVLFAISPTTLCARTCPAARVPGPPSLRLALQAHSPSPSSTHALACARLHHTRLLSPSRVASRLTLCPCRLPARWCTLPVRPSPRWCVVASSSRSPSNRAQRSALFSAACFRLCHVRALRCVLLCCSPIPRLVRLSPPPLDYAHLYFTGHFSRGAGEVNCVCIHLLYPSSSVRLPLMPFSSSFEVDPT